MGRWWVAMVLGGFLAVRMEAQPVPGLVLYKTRPGMNATGVSAATCFGTAVQQQLTALGLRTAAVQKGAESSSASRLSGQSAVQLAQPIYTYDSAATPNDPLFRRQYGPQLIGTPLAWDVVTGNTSPTIAIVDTGVDPRHPDLAAKLVPGFNFFNNTSVTDDRVGHGTEVAGVAAAIGNNGIGIAGMAWQNPIMPIVVSDGFGRTNSALLAAGIKYAADHGAGVINVGFGPIQGDSVVYAATQYAVSKGALVFAPAGNTGRTNNAPAEASIIFVSATTRWDRVAYFSTSGPSITLAAPGVDIVTTALTSIRFGSGYTDGFRPLPVSGTSFSSALAAGLATLVWSVNPSMSNTTVRNFLITTAQQPDPALANPNKFYGFGRIDAANAVLAAANQPLFSPPVVTILSPTNGTTVSGTVSVTVSATDSVSVTSVHARLDNQRLPRTAVAPPLFTFTLNTLPLTNGTHTITATALDSAGLVGVAPTVSITVNNTPTVTIRYPPPGATLRGTVSVDWRAGPANIFTDVIALVDGTLYNRQTDWVHGNRFTSGTIILRNTRRTLTAGTHTLQLQALQVSGPPVLSASQTFIYNTH